MAWSELHNKSEIQSKIAAGDPEAFNELYKATSKVLYSAVYAFVKNTETAEDIVQITYLKIWRQREKLMGINDLGKYLFVLARNAAFDHLKANATRHKLMHSLGPRHEDLSNPILDDIIGHEAQRVFEKALSRLPPRQLHAYRLSMEKNLTNPEIARQMEISTFTVRRHLEAARQFVRAFMKEHLDIHLIVLAGSLHFYGLAQ